jgi:hypothetical protein
MTLKEYLSIGSLIVSVVSLAIAATALFRARKVARSNFRLELRQHYAAWRASLGSINIDPPPNKKNRQYTEDERRKIRDYWPKVVLIELEWLKGADRAMQSSLWQEWEELWKAGIAHHSIVQEFCFYANYEDTNYGPRREEMICLVYRLYKEINEKELDCDKILQERKKFTTQV